MGPTISRLLRYPITQHHEVLTEDVPVETKPVAANASAQVSFLNGLAGDLDARVVHIYKNTDQRLIVVTQDKTLLTLKKNMANLGKKEWLAPLSTVTTILLALLTSNFRFALGLGPEEWRAIFIVSGLISCGWFAFAIRKSLAAKGFNEVVADIVHELGNHRKASY